MATECWKMLQMTWFLDQTCISMSFINLPKHFWEILKIAWFSDKKPRKFIKISKSSNSHRMLKNASNKLKFGPDMYLNGFYRFFKEFLIYFENCLIYGQKNMFFIFLIHGCRKLQISPEPYIFSQNAFENLDGESKLRSKWRVVAVRSYHGSKVSHFSKIEYCKKMEKKVWLSVIKCAGFSEYKIPLEMAYSWSP